MRQSILGSIRVDVEEGYLTGEDANLRRSFTDFLEMAEHLDHNGYKCTTAYLTGAVLEDGLRKLRMRIASNSKRGKT